MHSVFTLHAATLPTATAGLTLDGPLPGPPSAFVRAWLGAAVPWSDEALGARLLRHYAVDSVNAWVQRFYAAPPAVHELVRLDLREADVPRLRVTLDRLLVGARRAGLPVEATWGAQDGAALLDRSPRVIDLHATAFFGCCQPLVSLGPPEQDAIARYVEAGWTPAEVLDVRLAGHVVHELAHGPARDWQGGPASWMLHEAAAAVVNHDCQAGHVIAERPGEPVLGLRNALVLGRALVDAVGTEAVWRLALGATSVSDVVGRRVGHALTAVDWQLWAGSRRAAFMPVHERLLAWAKLVDLARGDRALLPALDFLEQAESVTPQVALAVPDLLAAAEAVPWERLEGWQAPVHEGLREDLWLAICSLWHSERLQPDLQAVPSDPPGGEVRLEVARCALTARTRGDDPHGQPLVWRMPPPLCRQLLARGLRGLTVQGCAWERRELLRDRLWELATGRSPLGADLELDLRDRAFGGPAPLRTEVRTQVASRQLHHTDAIVTLGSCFATHIGERLKAALFEVHDNPLGILYDPISVLRGLQLVATGASLPEDLLFSAHGRWHSPWHHTDLSHVEREVAWRLMAGKLADAQQARGRPGTWLLTWGTAWVWEPAQGGEVVANCHGLPEERFRSRLLTVEELVQQHEQPLAWLAEHAPDLQLVLTLSPIRHLAQGVVGNQRSKATLHLAAQQLAERWPRLSYFPAYELVLDELRDYRWYEPDLVHLTSAAADQVYERFLDTFVAPASRSHARAVAELGRRLVGTPRDPVRGAVALDEVLEALDALPRSPVLPRPDQLRTAVIHTRDAARALGGEPAAIVRQAPAPSSVTRVTPVVDEPVVDPLPALIEALNRGTFIGWEALSDWSGGVAHAVRALVGRRGGDNAMSWRALEAVLGKVDELESSSAVAPLVEPLIADVLRRAGAPGSLPDTVVRLAELLVQQVVRGQVEAGAATLRAGGEELRRCLAEVVAVSVARQEAAGRRVPEALRALVERVGQ